MRRPRVIQFELNIPQIISQYASTYINNAHAHESLEDFADQVAGDLRMPDAKKWFLDEVAKQQNGTMRRAA